MPVDTIDEALAPHIIGEQLYDIAVNKWGSTEAQAADFAALYRNQFALVNGVAVHQETNFQADHDEVQKFYGKTAPHLLPPKFEVPLADKAFIQRDVTARGALFKELGAAAANDLARRYGLDGVNDYKNKATRPENLVDPEADKKKTAEQDRKNNPWSKAGWNLTRQGQLLKSLPVERVAAIAASVGSRIGATHPTE